MKCCCLPILVISLTSSVARGGDLEFGLDAIPRLYQRSGLIVVSASAKFAYQTKSPPTFNVFMVTIAGEPLKGSLDGRSVQVVTPESVLLKDDEFAGSILFLGPIDLSPHKFDKKSGPVCELVGGHNGLIAPQKKDQQSAINEYTREAKGKSETGLLRWAEKYFRNSDPYLQRSSVFQAAELTSSKMGSSQAYKVLEDALKAKEVRTSTKGTVLISLQSIGGEKSQQMLMTFALDKTADSKLRHDAILYVGGFKDGEFFLRKWERIEEDAVLSSGAKNALKIYGVKKNEKGPDGLQGSLTAARRVFDDPKSSSASILREIEKVGALDHPEAAKLLVQIALDNKSQFDMRVRSNAILAISRMNARISQPILTELSKSLCDEGLRRLVIGLID